MARVTFTDPLGNATVAEIREGWSLMQGARAAGIEGIVAECGGACSCATCHCYVDEAWLARIPAPSAEELQMLANVADERRPNSRLSCQVKIGAELDGLRVSLPARQ